MSIWTGVDLGGLPRIYRRMREWGTSYAGGIAEETSTSGDADVITSQLADSVGVHAPVLDLDVPHRLVPSSTAGHAHLYLDVPMSWWRYKRLLRALWKAGVIEKGFYRAAVSRGYSAVRVPWKHKVDTDLR